MTQQSHSKYLPNWHENLSSYQNLKANIYSIFIHNHQKFRTTHMFFN